MTKFTVLINKPDGRTIAEFVAYKNSMELIGYNDTRSVICQSITNGILSARFDNIILISPNEKNIHDVIAKLSSNFSTTEISVTDSCELNGYTSATPLSSIAFNKSIYRGIEFQRSAEYYDVINSLINLSMSSKIAVNEYIKRPVRRKTSDTSPQQLVQTLAKYDASSMLIADKNPKDISIILPFAHNGDRQILFDIAVQNLYELTKNYKNIEICIHESSSNRYITDEFIDKFNVRYLYTEWNEVFHRSWNLNVAARYLASGDYLCFFDGDLMVDKDWVKELVKAAKSKFCGHGWGTLKYIPENCMDRFFNNGNRVCDDFRYNMEREPHFWNCAGGINVISRKTFFDVGGWPEDFRGMWGGPDNAFIIKLSAFNLYDGAFNALVYHMHHKHITFSDKEARRQILEPMVSWTSEMWKKHIRKNDGFGDLNQSTKMFVRNV